MKLVFFCYGVACGRARVAEWNIHERAGETRDIMELDLAL